MGNPDIIRTNIKNLYLAESKPFVIGFSGGKDSTATLQIVWETLREIPHDERKNHIYVIFVDTLVETPYIAEYINETISGINEAAKKENMPISALKLVPKPDKTFWVNLIGRGYPAPSQMFRWCTEKLKIAPVNDFINNTVKSYGEVILVLGTRKSESISRSIVFKNRQDEKEKNKFNLSFHQSISGAYVFTPIEDMSDDDVWEYLLRNNSNPWSGSNRNLAAMYQNATDGDCQLVLDTNTPSCGSSRFGCWVCTLVVKDTSMENIIDSGEDWLIPLLDFRNLLNSTQSPELKPQYRSYKRRNGRAALVKDKSHLSYGPYKFEWKMKFLKMLLSAQKSVQENGPDASYQLISIEELKLIRKIWKEEDHDWEDSVPKIYEEIIGIKFPKDFEDGINFNTSDFALLEGICRSEDLPSDLVARLIDEERKLHGMSKRSGILTKLDRVLNEEWRSEEQVIAEDVGTINEN